MASILDYLDWRGDITFAERPFNEVDNLLLAELSYLDFGGIVPADFAAAVQSHRMNSNISSAKICVWNKFHCARLI